MLFDLTPETSATMALMNAAPQVHNLEFGALTTGAQGQRCERVRRLVGARAQRAGRWAGGKLTAEGEPPR